MCMCVCMYTIVHACGVCICVCICAANAVVEHLVLPLHLKDGALCLQSMHKFSIK